MKHFYKLSVSIFLCTFLFNCHKKSDPTPITTTTPTKVPGVSVFAGDGNSGSTDGQGSQAEFLYPVALTIDKNNNLYVADYGNNVIRKITPNGIVSTFAGSGLAGSKDAPNTFASFYHPTGLVVDKVGNIIVADQYNNMIRKITPDGTVTTLAGSVTSGSNDGQGTAASFYAPTGVAINSLGNIYVTDQGNNRIRMITPDGMVTTIAGSTSGYTNAAGTSAQFNGPLGLAFDSGDTLYVTEFTNNSVRKITPSGVVSTLAGSLIGTAGYINSQGAAAEFNQPYGIIIDANNNLYIADEANNVIRKITHSGTVTTFAGTGSVGTANGTLLTCSFNVPKGVILDSHNNMFVADGHGQTIRKIVF
jgi:sugar lactone lactonase YvrE